jgi:WD40 repeat protein
VWDWKREQVTLRTKAFSQEVFRVQFAPGNEGRLISSGTGHIRFWKMASTFTGLKLQGAIGKFGQVELSDISCFVELPDGKVISGTETGALLMWDDQFVEFQILREDRSPCHAGAVEFLAIEGRELISAGRDGYIRRWPLDSMEFVQVDEDDAVLRIKPIMETHCGGEVEVLHMLRGDDHWLVQDAKGGLTKVFIPSYEVERILDVHAGQITELCVSPVSHIAVTCGVDGSVRCWDIAKAEAITSKRFGAQALSMVWAPDTVDPDNRTLLVGFSDGVLRVLQRFADNMKLITVIKPHSCPVIQLALAPDGTSLVTAGQDGSLFFFSIGSMGTKIEPMGFITLPGPVRALQWAPNSDKVIMVCGGEVVEVVKPRKEDIPESDSFAIELETTRWRPEIPVVRKIDVTPEGDVEVADENKEYKMVTEMDVERVDPLSAVLYCLDGERFYVTLDGTPEVLGNIKTQPAERYECIYECSFKKSQPLKRLPLGDGVGSVESLHFSASKKYLMIGTAAGAAQMRPIDDMDFFFLTTSHDGMNGAVTRCASTFDDGFMVTVGKDGNFFAHAVAPEMALKSSDRRKQLEIMNMVEKKKRLALPKPKRRAQVVEDGEEAEPEEPIEDPILPAYETEMRLRMRQGAVAVEVEAKEAVSEALEPAAEGEEGAADITDGAMYSVEEAKVKEEDDLRMSAADKKKHLVRVEVQELRKEFQVLLKRNEALDEDVRLPRDAFELDPRLREQLEMEAQAQIDQVKKELAWISEKHDFALRKLRAHFLDNLIVEHIRLASFKTNMIVTCFRTPELPPFLRKAIEKVHEIIESEERSSAERTLRGARDDLLNGVGEGFSTKKGATLSKAAGKKKSVKNEAEARKKARVERKKQLDKLKATKPDKSVDDPMDVAAVQYAERNMGDYKLKSDPKYVVPEHQRVNAERKRRQMVLLQESVHFIKMGYNERFLAMRDLKTRIIKNVQKDNVRLAELNKKLGIKEALYEPQTDLGEFPEQRDAYTKDDLKAFVVRRAKDVRRADAKNKGIVFVSDDEELDVEAAEEAKEAASEEKREAKEQEEKQMKAAAVIEAVAKRMEAVPKSDMEIAQEKVRKQQLVHERKTLLEKIEYAIFTFDTALASLRREKLKLDIDLKTTDMKLLTLYQELTLLKEFEENENTLLGKVQKARTQKVQVVSEKKDCEKQLNHKLADIKAWQEKDKQVVADFNSVVGGEKSEFYPQLLRIFKKKVKRSKKKAQRGDDDEDDEEDSEEDSDGSMSEEESDSDEENDDSCPLNCDSAIYEKVLELREKRMEQEDILAEFNKAVIDLNKLYERHQTKERAIDKDLEATEIEIEAFQSTKQRALNEIEVTIPLKLSQVKYIYQNKMAEDITNGLIFTSTGLQRLKNRISELHDEKAQLTRQFKELKRGHKVLLKELRAKNDVIAIEQKKCEDVQMLKFGQIIDLSILAKVGVDEGAAELKDKLQKLEAQSVHKLMEWDVKIQESRDELALITQQNTRWLERVGQLTKAQYDLEDSLNQTTKNVHVADSSPSDEKSDGDRRQLLQLVHIQEKEIDALKAEIHVLRRKGGHVYTPST